MKTLKTTAVTTVCVFLLAFIAYKVSQKKGVDQPLVSFSLKENETAEVKQLMQSGDVSFEGVTVLNLETIAVDIELKQHAKASLGYHFKGEGFLDEEEQAILITQDGERLIVETRDKKKDDHSFMIHWDDDGFQLRSREHGLAGTLTLFLPASYNGKIHRITVSADIKARNLKAEELDLKTVSGDIELERLPRKTELKTVSGEMEVIMPTDQGVDLVFKTISGDVDAPFPVTQKSTGVYEAKVGAGEVSLSVKSVSGDIKMGWLP